uniref:RNA-directed DNA polymerase n=1 Tax=Plectus sambesii TaxID=2011161 RepID=A0A914XAI4_9BILA
MLPSKNLNMLRSFLGMVNHYGKFLPSLYDRLAPLHKLLKKDANDKHVKFEWSAECQKAFERIKADLASPLMLTHYKLELPIIVAANASNEGISAVIAHQLPNGRELPIAYASKTLTDTESRYPQIEKEALALMFGIKKFHQYLWGRHFLLQTDHQPLVKIFGSKKGLPMTAANRLQNYAITLMAYSFDIEYVNTLKFGKADGLSRLPSGEDVEFQPMMKKVDCAIVDIYTETFSTLPVSAANVQAATATDQTFQAVMALHCKGWPDHLLKGFKLVGLNVHVDDLMPFFRIRHQLAIANDCLLWAL